ncbi:MAG: DUF4350 domain-containing protein [Bacteroidota bacterium]
MMPRLFFILLAFLPCGLLAQQDADTDFEPPISQPAYAKGQGPVVFIDEGHFNFHTKEGRYKAFSNLLERDGYQVQAYQGVFKPKKLAKGKILVISNALNEKNVEHWFLPNFSAFSQKEIEVLKNWVAEGGSLFLIADHMPMAGAAEDLASAFGFEFTNGFVLDTLKRGPAIFNLEEKTLVESLITNGRNADERVKQVATFTGQAFKIPEEAKPILIFDEPYINLLPDTAWVFEPQTPRHSAKDWIQGAYRSFGKGKVVAFGEAAMFTAQLAGPQKVKMGMNNPAAPENYQLLLNIIHWLDGLLE